MSSIPHPKIERNPVDSASLEYRLPNLEFALKEWAATIEALFAGEQIFLIRKGGIREPDRRFELKHHRFLLYPTRFHESTDMLKPEFQRLIKPQVSEPAETVEIKAFSQVEDVIDIDAAEDVLSLSGYHAWTDEFVTKRIAWKPRHAASLILLKTYILLEPVCIRIEPQHIGCKSWVDIEPAIELDPYFPALRDEVWEERADAIRSIVSKSRTASVIT